MNAHQFNLVTYGVTSIALYFIMGSVVSFYYYILVVKQAYIAEDAGGSAIALGAMGKLTVGVLAGLLLLLGLSPLVADWLAARSGL